MRAVLLINTGSPEHGSGAAMIRMAARVRDAGIAPIVAAGFLHHSRPTFAEAFQQSLERGATEVVVLPYELTSSHELHRLLAAACAAHPDISVRLTEPLGGHPALAQVIMQRANEAGYIATNQFLARSVWPDPVADWRADGPIASATPAVIAGQAGLLIVASAEPGGQLKRRVSAVVQHIRTQRRYRAVEICSGESSGDDIAHAINRLVGRTISQIIVLPYVLLANRALTDMIATGIAAARIRHPDAMIIQAGPLAYDRRLLAAIADRVAQALIE